MVLRESLFCFCFRICIFLFLIMWGWGAHLWVTPEKVTAPLELKLQVVESLPVGLLGTKCGSFARAIYALNCQAVSPAQQQNLLKICSTSPNYQLEMQAVAWAPESKT